MTLCPYCSNHQTKMIGFKIISGIAMYEYACQMCLKHFWVQNIRENE